MKHMHSFEEVKTMIENGDKLLLAGDKTLLSKLPAGNWIGGTIPYFMADEGGIVTKDKIYVDKIPDYVQNIMIKEYNDDNIQRVFSDMYDNGYSVIILPAFSNTHFSFALKAPTFDNFAMSPLIGWVSGFLLDDNDSAYVYGNGIESNKNAIVMHIELPEDKYAHIEIVNIFKQGNGDIIEFPETGFSTTTAIINGKSVNFAEYLRENNVDIKLPLVADYMGTMVNVSFQSIENDLVKFYAPVFNGIKYKLAENVDDYINEFTNNLPIQISDKIQFSCNCILNFIYSDLQGKQTSNITGPITFGEIAYQLLNQTMVSIVIENI